MRTDIAIDSVQLLLDRHNEDPNTIPDKDIQASDPKQPSELVSHEDGGLSETSRSLLVSKA